MKSFTINIKIIIAIIILLSQNTFAQNYQLKIISDNVNSIKFLKKKSFKKTFTDSLILLSELEKIKSKLLQKGYISASLDSIIYDSTNVKAYLFTGKKYNTEISINQNNSDKTINKKNITTKQKTNSNELFSAYEKIIKYYENNGYPFACIVPKNVSFNDENINLEIEIKKNRKIKINKLIIKGDAKISKTFIKRYLSIFEGNFYNETIISEINNKLNNLNFITQIRKPEIDFYGNNADVYIYIKNKKSNSFDGILGLIPKDENNNNLSFTGNIKFMLVNALGIGGHTSFSWERTKEASQKLNISSNIPYLFKSPFGMDIYFKLDKSDTTYMTVAEKIGIKYSFKNNDKLTAYFKNSSSYILSSQNIDTTIFKDVNTVYFGMSYQTQKLNYIYNPLKGYNFLLDISNGTRNINDLKYSSLEINSILDFYFPVYKKFVYKLSFKNKYIISEDNLFKNELYKVGGFNSIRGFDEDAFFTKSFSVLTNEIRFLYERNSNVYIFSDIARIEQTKDNLLLYGFGIGTNFSTKAGIFSISYALGKIDNNPIQFSNSKIHLGYINRF